MEWAKNEYEHVVVDVESVLVDFVFDDTIVVWIE